jgi:hypothetical protein
MDWMRYLDVHHGEKSILFAFGYIYALLLSLEFGPEAYIHLILPRDY